MKVKFKDDYLKLATRKQITSTIRSDVYEKFRHLSVSIDQPTSKMFDVALLQIFKDEKSIQTFINKVKDY